MRRGREERGEKRGRIREGGEEEEEGTGEKLLTSAQSEPGFH